MAQRIQQKRSSIEGRRPDPSYIEPGELAINTNANDPGLFFEANDGSIIKTGPTFIGENQPSSSIGYGHGEQWFDSANNALRVWDSSVGQWLETLAAPWGGTEKVVYVGSSFPFASDDLDNTGSNRPFATLNRACLEIARRSILQNRSDAPSNNRFVIVLLPGVNVVHNEPGLNLQEFLESEVVFNAGQNLTPSDLRKFNSKRGGLIVPRGTSIQGLDKSKVVISPSYYPRWTRFEFESRDYETAGRSNILNWTGNTLLRDLTFRDKRGNVSVTQIDGTPEDIAILHSEQPHCFRTLVVNDDNDVEAGDTVNLQYLSDVSRFNDGTPSIPEGEYYVHPLSQTTFSLRNIATGEAIFRKELPAAPSPGTQPFQFLTLGFNLKTHHMLSAVGYSNREELDEYYSKVQAAYAGIQFGGAVNDAEVVDGEFKIGTELPRVAVYPVDSVTDISAEAEQVRIQSNYGMCGFDIDGNDIDGLKSAQFRSSEVMSLQNDPDVYEVYYDSHWIALTEAAWRAAGIEPAAVTDNLALTYLTSKAQVADVRFYFRFAKDIDSAKDQSSGLPDIFSDCRHFGFRGSNEAHLRIDSPLTLGCAIGVWTMSGSHTSIKNGRSELGGQALRSEGFAGIGTMGGSQSVLSGFEVQGIRRPAIIPAYKVTEDHLVRLQTNSGATSYSNNSINLTEPFDPRSIYPYTLRPGTVIWVRDNNSGAEHKATLANPATNSAGTKINLETSDNGIASLNAANMSNPYVRRMVDPRPEHHRDYSLWIKNTQQEHQAPFPGCVVRYTENTSASVVPLLYAGKQLDPGENGGWNHTFTVHRSLNKHSGDNPDALQPKNSVDSSTEGYYVTLNPSDSFGPWIDGQYARGANVVTDNRVYDANYAQTAASADKPSEAVSVWEGTHNYEPTQSVKEAYIAETSYSAAKDPNFASYDEKKDTYARGFAFDSDSYSLGVPLDYDDGTAKLGLTNNGKVKNQYADPAWRASRIAVERFLALLGYEQSDINSLMGTQIWSQRNIPVVQFPTLGSNGYAISAGNWPVEFCRPSMILCDDNLWENVGHLNYSKGLPQYQTSQLSEQQRRDNEISEVWGGRVIASGVTGRGGSVDYRTVSV